MFRDKTRASFVVSGLTNNAIFDLAHQRNRDNCFYPYHLLRERLKQYGLELDTADLTHGEQVAFALHMNVQELTTQDNSYLLMLEPPQVCPQNYDSSNLVRYRKIFTWNDHLVDGNDFIKINLPNQIHVHGEDGFEKRPRFCCLIAGNKTFQTEGTFNLYFERVKAIRWFERHAPKDFDLFGVDWNMPVLHRGLLGKVERRIFKVFGRLLNLRPFPSYRGRIECKREVLTQTRFSICYENVRDVPGYITEKIFDCFFSGCVPVYWGANNITTHIPEDCFIDRRKFRDTGELYAFLKVMSEQEYIGYQHRIAKFLSSDKAYLFSAEYFAETIVKTIVQDLEA
jgi:hypothetical protein